MPELKQDMLEHLRRSKQNRRQNLPTVATFFAREFILNIQQIFINLGVSSKTKPLFPMFPIFSEIFAARCVTVPGNPSLNLSRLVGSDARLLEQSLEAHPAGSS